MSAGASSPARPSPCAWRLPAGQPLGTRDGDDQACAIDGLGEVIERAVLLRLPGTLYAGHPGQKNNGKLQITRTDRAQELQSRHIRHHDVADHHIKLAAVERRESLAAITGLSDFEPLAAENARDDSPKHLVIFDQQNVRGRLRPNRHGFALARSPVTHWLRPLEERRVLLGRTRTVQRYRTRTRSGSRTGQHPA
ncbi:MAG: hypothetical protein M3O46_05610 [Myxococcota bacterium]|nr:hypothetical protein [Myxococcota bacterium]